MHVGRGAVLQQTEHVFKHSVIQKHHFLIAGKKEKRAAVQQVRMTTSVQTNNSSVCMFPSCMCEGEIDFVPLRDVALRQLQRKKNKYVSVQYSSGKKWEKDECMSEKTSVTVWTPLWSHFICTAHTDGELLFSRDLCMSHMCTHESNKLFKVQTVRQKRQTDTKKRHCR